MIKWLAYGILALLVGGSWLLYSGKGAEEGKLKQQINQIYEQGDPEGKVAELESKLQNVQGERTFNGVLLAILSAGLVGVCFVTMVLPNLVQRATHAVYDSGEMVEKDAMHDARSLLAQGDYEGAIAAFRAAAAAQPLNRLPWVEITKIYKEQLHNPDAAIQTIRQALEGHEWEQNDAAYLLFRLAELYDECAQDRVSALAIMQQVMDQFPGTRHSANARHRIQEWGNVGNVGGAVPGVPAISAQQAAEEREYLEKMRSSGKV